MNYENYRCLKINVNRGVAFVTIDHPPINLLDRDMLRELDTVGKDLEADNEVRVVVFQSANPDFFIPHLTLLGWKLTDKDPKKETSLSYFHQIMERIRTLSKATIGKLEGCARGGGSELLLSLDMRFGAIGRAILSQPEVGLGVIPAGGGTQRLTRLIGRGRALEVILGCQDIPAELAERYGYINRALPPEELTPFVEQLAYRIASFPAEAIALAKTAVNAAEPPVEEGLFEEAYCCACTLSTKQAQQRFKKFIEMGGQTRKVELFMSDMLDKLGEED
jgi:enoyl-CoA hydratase/carnithine racemase